MTSDCTDVRTSLSARTDGEDAPLAIEVVDAHVATCTGCEAFAAGLSLLGERVAAARRTPVPDRTAQILATPGEPERATSGPTVGQLQWLLGLAAVVQAVVAITGLVGFGGDHLVRDLAAFELAAAWGLAAAAWRPAMAAGLLPVVVVAVAFDLVAIVADVTAGLTTVGAELPHLVLFVAVWPLLALARHTGFGGSLATP